MTVLVAQEDGEVVGRHHLAVASGEPQRLLGVVHVTQLRERDPQPPGELHVPLRDERAEPLCRPASRRCRGRRGPAGPAPGSPAATARRSGSTASSGRPSSSSAAPWRRAGRRAGGVRRDVGQGWDVAEVMGPRIRVAVTIDRGGDHRAARSGARHRT